MLRFAFSDNEGLRPIEYSIHLTSVWIKKMRVRGLIEQIPGLKTYTVKGEKRQKVALFRLSADGRRVIKACLETFRECHKDIGYFVKTRGDRDYLRRVMARFIMGVSYEELDAADTGQELDDIVDLTKSDLKRMGYRGTGKKPDYWNDMLD
jgi:hypothetical protein